MNFLKFAECSVDSTVWSLPAVYEGVSAAPWSPPLGCMLGEGALHWGSAHTVETRLGQSMGEGFS